MSPSALGAPDTTEYAPYYGMYIQQVPPGDIVDTLETQLADALATLRRISEDRGDHRYAPDKWSIKELLGHVIDTERIFATRALAFSRNDTTPLPGFEQDDYVAAGRYNHVPLKNLVEEFEHLRRSNILMFRGLDATMAAQRGTANDCPFTARAVAWILAGHERHHMQVLQKRYLGDAASA